jgi:predicted TPR repeat methyltransferase
MKLLSLFHRALLRLKPYRKLIVMLGLDSYRYKKYYKDLHFKSVEGVSLSDVDDYKDEGDYEKIVQLVDNIFRQVPAPRAVLDIGCGTGRYLKQMMTVSPASHFEGIDISMEIVEKFTRKQVPGVPIHVMDIETDETFHIENREKFDLVCMIGIIQVLSLKKIHPILDRINILSKTGGYLYLQFNVETEKKKSSIGYKRYSIEELEELLAEHGFETVQGNRTDILKDYAYIFAIKK